MKCEVCQLEEAKYKCPVCSIRYCSLKCYKDTEKHKHSEETKKEDSTKPAENNTSETNTQDNSSEIKLRSPEMDKIYQETPQLQELLQYNTVKFHLAKVYRILNSSATGGNSASDSSTGSTEMKRQLAVEYLNTLRFGGIHYNEAIEEFCEIFLEKLEAK